MYLHRSGWAWVGGVKGLLREESRGISQAALRARERISRWVSRSAWAWEGREERSRAGRTSWSSIWEALGAGVEERERVHCCGIDLGVAALRQTCLKGAAIVL